MNQEEIISAWARYGILVEKDTADFWRWAETDEKGNENGPFSPPFGTFERCISDLEQCFGKLKDQIAMTEQITIEIDVEGGMVQAVKAPPGVVVKVNDYDVLDAIPDGVDVDTNGDDYVEQVFVGTGDWEEAT